MKKLFCLLLSCVLIILASVQGACAEEVMTSATAYVLYCPDNGAVLLSQNSDRQMPMASTTKIMTTLITLEHAAEDNAVVEFSEDMIAEGSSMYLKVGEKVRLDDLAVGMMMQSGNDAANAAAIAIAGSIEGFADLMNEKAQAIGMEHSHFVTPSGLDDEAHYSTACDMALLMAYALQNERFAAITAQNSMTVDFTEPDDKSVTYPNHNKLLRLYDSCIGGKTGYTDSSGRCLVSAARQDDLTLIAVTLDDRDDWDDHIALYDYGFARYISATLPIEESYSVSAVGGMQETLQLLPDEAPKLVLPKDETDAVDIKIHLPSFVYAPIEEGSAIGRISYSVNGEAIGEIALRAADTISYDDRRRGFFEYIKDILIRKK